MRETRAQDRSPLRTYKELPDMSTEGDFGRVVTIYVGSSPCVFQAHLSRLGPLAELLDPPSRKSPASISLPNENAETFNALMHWIYNGSLPYAPKPTTDDADSSSESASDSGSDPGSDSDSDGPQMSPTPPPLGAGIPFRPRWEGYPPSFFSPPFLSSAAHAPASASASSPSFRSKVSKTTKHEHRKGQKQRQKEKEKKIKQKQKEQKKKDEKEENQPLTPAQATQCLLLDLAMFAERHVWETLYNAALDAYRAGEANLRRARPSPLHVAIVYGRTRPGSAVRVFIADYVYARAREQSRSHSHSHGHGGLMWWYEGNKGDDDDDDEGEGEEEGHFAKIPGLLRDMLARVDGCGPFAYPLVRGDDNDHEGDDHDGGRGGDVLESEAPLDLDATTYHVHGGRMVLDCVRGEDGKCGVVGDGH